MRILRDLRLPIPQTYKRLPLATNLKRTSARARRATKNSRARHHLPTNARRARPRRVTKKSRVRLRGAREATSSAALPRRLLLRSVGAPFCFPSLRKLCSISALLALMRTWALFALIAQRDLSAQAGICISSSQRQTFDRTSQPVR